MKQYQIDLVRRELPNVTVEYRGQIWLARVTGRLNQFATVALIQVQFPPKGVIQELIGGVQWEFSWEAIARNYYGGGALKV